MNARLVLVLFLVVMLPAGCVTANKKAAQLADQGVYQPVSYENAAVPGPEIVVLPGEIKSSNYAFLQKVTTNNLRDFAEIELSKDNFKVLDRADVQPLFEEIALAANLGDAEALKVFRKGRFKTTNWFLTFNILKAEPTVAVSKSFDGATAGALIDLAFTLANNGERNSAGKMLGQTVASAKSADTSAIWLVGLQYKIVDATTGEQVASGYIEDKMEATASMNSFLGATNQQRTAITLDTMAQRLIQKAVAEIDKKYKGTGAAAREDEPAGKGGRARKAAPDAKKEKALLAGYRKKIEEHRAQKDKEAAVAAARVNGDGFANLDQEAVLATLTKDNHSKFHKKYDAMFKLAQTTPDWRQRLRIDMSGVTCDVAEYRPEACTLRIGGTYTVATPGKVLTYAKDESLAMVKEDGRWKIASWNDVDDRQVGEEKTAGKGRSAKAAAAASE